METLASGWIAEIAKNGLGWMLFGASLYVLWRKDTELNALAKNARDNEVKMAVALEQAARAMSDMGDVERSRNETDKVNASVLTALIKQIDVSDDRNKERADAIVRAIEGRHNAR